ncbi:MAG: hypothetical protein RI985_2058, partial [Chloroflexota bacterium]
MLISHTKGTFVNYQFGIVIVDYIRN